MSYHDDTFSPIHIHLVYCAVTTVFAEARNSSMMEVSIGATHSLK